MDSAIVHNQVKTTTRLCSKLSSKLEHSNDVGDGIPPKLFKDYSSHSLTLELQMQKLKISLEGWRYVILPLRNILLWEQQWYAGALIGGSTLFFFLLWIFDLSVLTTLSLIGLFIALADYFVPTLSASISKPGAWNNSKQTQYENICKTMIYYYYKIFAIFTTFCQLRNTRPKVFYCYTIPTLIFLAWIGNNFNNLFLTYLMTTTLLMVPGMEHNGLLCKYGCIMSQKFTDLLANNKLNKKQE